MKRYRKKPVVVEAERLTKANAEKLAEWCGGRIVEEIDPFYDGNIYAGLNIPTLEGVMRASEGDYVVRGIQGEFYPVKPHIFDDSYEACD